MYNILRYSSRKSKKEAIKINPQNKTNTFKFVRGSCDSKLGLRFSETLFNC